MRGSWHAFLGIISDQLLAWAVKVLPQGEERSRLANMVIFHLSMLHGNEK